MAGLKTTGTDPASVELYAALMAAGADVDTSDACPVRLIDGRPAIVHHCGEDIELLGGVAPWV
jgi:hypothetical protein